MLLFLAACNHDPGSTDTGTPSLGDATLTVTSTAFADGAPIPARYTCDGEDVNPEIDWTGAPDGTAAYAIVVDDPDAPGGTFTHLVSWNVPPAVATWPENTPISGIGGVEGTNDIGQLGFGGPCPPDGTHHYRFRVVAQAGELPLDAGASRDEFDAVVGSLALGEGTLTGTYQRASR